MNMTSSRLALSRLKISCPVLAAAVVLGVVGVEGSLAIEGSLDQSQSIQFAANEVANQANGEAADPAVSRRFIRALLSKALSLNEQFMDLPTDKYRAQIRAAELYIEMGENAAASEALQEAIAITREFESSEYRATQMAEVATIYDAQLDDSEQMEAILRQALTLTDEVESHQISNVVETVASVYAQTGRYDEAIAITDQFPDVSFIEHERESVIRQSAIHAATQGEHDLARELILEAEGIVQPQWEGLSVTDYQERIASTKADMIDYLTAHYYQNEQFEQGQITADIEKALIESVSDPLERVDLYLTMATSLNWHDVDEAVLSVLDRAIAAAEQLKNEGTGDRDCYLREADNRLVKIGAMMIRANDASGGLALLDSVENVPCAVIDKVEALIAIGRSNFDVDTMVQPITAEIEQLISQVSTYEQRASYWFNLADIYLRAEDLGTENKARAIQISDRLWQDYQSGELIRETTEETEPEVETGHFWGWDYVLSNWVQFLSRAEDYEKAARVAVDIDDQFMLDFFAPKLVQAGADELAWEAVSVIDDFDDKVEALRRMSLQYLRISEPEKAHEALSTATKTIENGDLTELIEADWYYKYDTGETLTQLEKEQIIRRSYLEYTFRLYVLSAGNDSAKRLANTLSDNELRQEMVNFIEQVERPEILDQLQIAASGKLTDEMMDVIQSRMIVSKSNDLWWEPLQEGDYAIAIEEALRSTPAYERGHTLMTIAEDHFKNPRPVSEQVYEQL